jgi:hypothetical protein
LFFFFIIQENASSWGYDQISDTVVFALRGLAVAYFGKMWLDRELWVQAFSSPSDAWVFDTVVQMYLVWVPTLVLAKNERKMNEACGYRNVSLFIFTYLILALLLMFYFTWWYPLLSSLAQCLGTDVETEATQNRLLLLSEMPSKTSYTAYFIAFVRVVVPINIMVYYGISTFAWYHRYMNTVNILFDHREADIAIYELCFKSTMPRSEMYGPCQITNREIINAKIEKFKSKCRPSKKTILYSEYGFVVLCIAIYSIEHYLNLFNLDNYIINKTVQFKDDTIKSIDGLLEVEGTKHTNASVACAKIIDDCHLTGFTCEEMIAAVQPGGCAGDCDDAIKNNMIQRYNDGEFESLCLNITSEALEVEVVVSFVLYYGFFCFFCSFVFVWVITSTSEVEVEVEEEVVVQKKEL